jgi:secondary thiamine-phosphate synthase enzyme
MIHQTTIELETIESIQFIDITDRVCDEVVKSGIKNGVVNVFTSHTTTAIKINERCDRLQRDMEEHLSGLAPHDGDYLHNIDTIDGRSNAHSHLMSLMLNASESIPVVGGEVQMGHWQSVFFVELDGPRNSRVATISIVGE